MGLLNRIRKDGLSGRSAGLLRHALSIRSAVEDEVTREPLGSHSVPLAQKKKPLMRS